MNYMAPRKEDDEEEYLGRARFWNGCACIPQHMLRPCFWKWLNVNME